MPILKVKDNDYLIFENSDYVFINDHKDKIKFTNLCDYINDLKFILIYLIRSQRY